MQDREIPTSYFARKSTVLDALGAHARMATHVLQLRCDQWASLDAELVTKDLPRASWAQTILKFRPFSSLDYKACHGPQAIEGCSGLSKELLIIMAAWVIANLPAVKVGG